MGVWVPLFSTSLLSFSPSVSAPFLRNHDDEVRGDAVRRRRWSFLKWTFMVAFSDTSFFSR